MLLMNRLPISLSLSLLLVFLPCSLSYTNIITLTESSSTTNFKSDLSECSCDISTACQPFCCCDTACSSALVKTWTNNNWCSSSSEQTQRLCANVGSKGYSSFQDLGCIMYSNRGSIGNFYTVPTSTDIVYTDATKYSTRNPNSQSISSYSLPSSSTTYQSGSPIKAYVNGSSTASTLLVWASSLGGSCRKSYVPLKQGTWESSCLYSITDSASCLAINTLLTSSSIQICKLYNCSSNITATSSLGTATYTSSTTTCANFIKKLTITITLAYVNSQYQISTFTLATETGSTSDQYAVLESYISIGAVSASASGNPGYIFNKALVYPSGGVYQIGTSASVCVLNSTISSTSSLLDINFGANSAFSCIFTNPCGSTLYIDEIAKATSFTVQKYASQSTQTITITPNTSACSYSTITLNILYSYAGWVLDPQYYLLGGKFTLENQITNTSAAVVKQFKIKWVKVEPDQVVTPPTNYFYQYFSEIWLPLKSNYYKYTVGEIGINVAVTGAGVLFLSLFFASF